MCNLIIDLAMIGLIFGLTASNADEGNACDESIVSWLYVYGGIVVLSFIFDISKIVFLGMKNSTNKCKLVFDTIMICTLLNF